MELRKIFIILGAVLSILGTYVFALFSFILDTVGSGLGFAMNFFDNVLTMDLYLVGAEATFFYVMFAIFIIWLISGVLQLVGLIIRSVGSIFSLFPLGVGIMFLLLSYTEFLEPISYLLKLYFAGEHFGNIFPILIDIGGGMGLGAFFLVGGGTLGLVGSIMPQD